MKKYLKGGAFYLLIFIFILLIVRFYSGTPQQVAKIDVTELSMKLEGGQVSTLDITANHKVTGTLKDGTEFTSQVPEMMNTAVGNEILREAKEQGVKIVGQQEQQSSLLVDMIPTIIMILMFVAFWFIFMRRSQGGSKVMSFGKNKAKKFEENKQKRITFAEVAGLKEEKEEMQEVVHFLKKPEKYVQLGARIPKGILMIGPPGTGKTYLSRAVAGEAGVPFYTISGSDFVEMFVGVGASRVRDLFETAKKNSPCIVFIDEIDAVGRKRGAGLGGGHDEREQTLNQLLVEMDGFDDNEGVILIAATNRPDILDPALLRPGRFDREVIVGIPDVKEREAILEVHSKKKPLGSDVNLETVARGTSGFTPADLENVLNEAAIIAAKENHKVIHMKTIEEATTKVIAGVQKKSRVMSDEEKRLTAYHEAGHAVLAHLLPKTDPVHQVTIIPRGRAGGFTMQLPKEDRRYMTKRRLENEIVVLLGGRLAEKLVLEDISTGAQNDLQRVAKIAKAMVTKYAMSENLSSMTYGSSEEVFIGRDMTSNKDFSEQVASEIDLEIRRIVDKAQATAVDLLESNMDKLHLLAESLLEYETIKEEEFAALMDEGKEAFIEVLSKKEAQVKKAEKRARKIEKKAQEDLQKNAQEDNVSDDMDNQTADAEEKLQQLENAFEKAKDPKDE